MDTSMENVTAIIIKSKNSHYFTRRFAKKISSGRNKNMTKKNKRKRLMYLKRYITISSFF